MSQPQNRGSRGTVGRNADGAADSNGTRASRGDGLESREYRVVLAPHAATSDGRHVLGDPASPGADGFGPGPVYYRAPVKAGPFYGRMAHLMATDPGTGAHVDPSAAEEGRRVAAMLFGQGWRTRTMVDGNGEPYAAVVPQCIEKCPWHLFGTDYKAGTRNVCANLVRILPEHDVWSHGSGFAVEATAPEPLPGRASENVLIV